MRTPSEILGIPPGASRAEARRAFQRYALRHHPDRGGDASRFQEGRRAYEAFASGPSASSRAPGNVAFVRRQTVRRRLAAVARTLSAHGHASDSQRKTKRTTRRARRW